MYYLFTYYDDQKLSPIEDVSIYGDLSEVPVSFNYQELTENQYLIISDQTQKKRVMIDSKLLESIVQENGLIYGRNWIQQLIPYVRDYHLTKILKK